MYSYSHAYNYIVPCTLSLQISNDKLAKLLHKFFSMQVCPGNEFGPATPLQLRPALRALYYLDTEADTNMKTKIIVIYCNTSYYTYVHKYTIL